MPPKKPWLHWQSTKDFDLQQIIHYAWLGKGAPDPDRIDLTMIGHQFYLTHVKPRIFARHDSPGWSHKAATELFVYMTMKSPSLTLESRSRFANAINAALLTQAYCTAALAGLSGSVNNFEVVGHALWQLGKLGGAVALATRAETREKRLRVAAATQRSSTNRAAETELLAKRVKLRAAELLREGVPARAINKMLATEFERTPQRIGELRKKQF